MDFSTFLDLQRDRIARSQTTTEDIRKARFKQPPEAPPLDTAGLADTWNGYDSVKAGYKKLGIIYE